MTWSSQNSSFMTQHGYGAAEILWVDVCSMVFSSYEQQSLKPMVQCLHRSHLQLIQKMQTLQASSLLFVTNLKSYAREQTSAKNSILQLLEM